MTDFVIQTLNGLTLGALYAFVAVGYTMVFGVIKLINFAHGEFYMAGGFAGLLSLLFLCGKGGPLAGASGEIQLVISLIAAGVAVGALAIVTERFAYRPVRGAGRISALLTAVGVSLLLQNVGITVFGSRKQAFPKTVEDVRYPRTAVELTTLKAGEVSARDIRYLAPLRNSSGEIQNDADGRPAYLETVLVDAGREIEAPALERAEKVKPAAIYSYPAVTVSKKQLIIFVSLAVASLALYWLVQRTRVGRGMRAVSHDAAAASLMGIDPGRIIALTFAVGGGLAGIGGVLAGGMYISVVDPMMGFLFGLKAFIAAVLGGIGSIFGALLGGLLLGLIEQYVQNYSDHYLFEGASAYRDAIAFVILIGVLLVKPTGLLGRIEGEKV